MKTVRRHYFIDRTFQLRFMSRFCAVVLIAASVIGALLLYFSQNSTTVAIENTKVIVKRTSDFYMPLVSLTTVLVAVGSAVVVLILTLFVSHQIAGPLYRIKREIESLQQGNLIRNFNLRHNDQLKELAASLNVMCSSLREKHTELRDKWYAFKSYLEAQNFTVNTEDRKRLMQIIEEIETTLKYFKV